MDNEPYRDLSHLELIATVSDWLRSQGHQVTNEHRLPHGKIADVIYRENGGAIHIVECKTFANNTLIKQAVDKYYAWCNALWIASPFVPRFGSPTDALSVGELEAARVVGLLEVGRGSVKVSKVACARELAPGFKWSVERELPPT